jgi:hypothetical protein
MRYIYGESGASASHNARCVDRHHRMLSNTGYPRVFTKQTPDKYWERLLHVRLWADYRFRILDRAL